MTDPASPTMPDEPVPAGASPSPPGASPSPAGLPRRRIAVLVGVAALTTLAVVAIVALTRGASGSSGSSIAVGQPVPNIAGTALDGSTVDLASLRGHPVVINFWASWCVPCQQEMPLLAQKAQAHAGSGLQILGVLSDDTAANGRAFEATYGATWPSVIDTGNAIKGAYRVVGRPQSYFVDKDGVLRSIQIGYLTDADFEQKFAKIAPTASGS